MHKKLFVLFLSGIFLTGCANCCRNVFKLNYKNPALTQLKGKHISVVQQRIDRFIHADTDGLLYNDYYLYRDCPYAGYDKVTTVTNGWGQVVDSYREPVYNCGKIFFRTDKDGVIEDYREDGYTPDTDYQSWFKDLIIIEK